LLYIAGDLPATCGRNECCDMNNGFLMAVVLGCTMAMASCTGMAKREVRSLVDSEEAIVGSSPALVTDAQVQSWAKNLGDLVLNAARSTKPELDPANKVDPTLDIFDRFTVYVVHDPNPNAWVVGDDFACVTTAAILLADGPNEIAFTLAHEFGHLRHAHMVKSVERRYVNECVSLVAGGLVVGLAAMGGTTGDARYDQHRQQLAAQQALLVVAAVQASYTPHRPKDELEADAEAVKLMAAAGLPVSDCDSFLRKLQVLHGDGNGKTHPPTSTRIERINQITAGMSEYRPTRVLSIAEFQQVQSRIRQLTLTQAKANKLSFYSFERAAMVKEHGLKPLCVCGLVDATGESVYKSYLRGLRLR